MSLYKNRIPRDSVSFSPKKHIFEYEEFNKSEEHSLETELRKETEDELKLNELKEKETILEVKEKQLKQLSIELDERKKQIELVESARQKEWECKIVEFEKGKLRDYYLMRGIIWDSAVELAEEIVNQSVGTEDFDVSKMFIGLLKKIPVSYDEISIVVHPETFELLGRSARDSFLLQNVKWKYDYSLDIGDFIVEDDKEFFEVKLGEIFDRIKKKCHLVAAEEKTDDE